MNYYATPVDEVLETLYSKQTGLKTEEAVENQQTYGRNEIKFETQPLWRKLAEPFANIFIGVLFFAALISFFTGHAIDGFIILAIIAVSAIIYYIQQFSTERVLRALKQHDSQTVSTYRDRKIVQIDSTELVPGDVIVLSEGEKVPADARLLSHENAKVDEAMLTGESLPIEKQIEALEGEKAVYEQTNMLFQGSFIVSGRITAVVTEIGMHSEFGKLAGLASSTPQPSPAQEKIDALVGLLLRVVSVIVVVAFLLALYRGMDSLEALRFVISLAVAAVPEGLPIAVTVVLVLGMRRLAKYNALARSMKSVENIGIITTIASDKTGTLTKNMLSVQEVWRPAQQHTRTLGEWIIRAANDAKGAVSDPLDTALATYAKDQKSASPEVESHHISFPFDQELAMSGNVWKKGSNYEVVLKGAPEKMIEHSYRGDSTTKKQVLDQLEIFTGLGYRVIALGRVDIMKKPPTELSQLAFGTMQFIGLVAIADELRPEAKAAIHDAQAAGITVRMITGDHAQTAFAIGKELGLVETRSQVLDCKSIQDMSDVELTRKVDSITVFARVIPEAKHRILGILKQTNITAMTGDGVNDVPALSNAHVGIAMGSGAQIAKESGDIVLLDDNFATIVKAVEGGRVIFDNIRRILFYMLTTTVGAVSTIMLALIAGLPLPVVAVQILWINLVTDTIFAIPLGLEPAEEDVMARKPRAAKQPILDRHILIRIGLVALTMASVTLLSFMYMLERYDLVYAQTVAFAVLVVAQWANAINARSEFNSFVKRLRAVNVPIYVGAVMAVFLQGLVMFGPLAGALHVVPVSIIELIIAAGIGFVAVIVVAELHKWYCRRTMFGENTHTLQ